MFYFSMLVQPMLIFCNAQTTVKS